MVRDIVKVKEDGEWTVAEDTKDYYTQDQHGNVWYFGEFYKEFEGGVLVSLEGSWTAGVDGAKPGIIMKADPKKEDVYRQEFLLGDAEDMGKVLSIEEASVEVPYGTLDEKVLKTSDFTPLEPDVQVSKYYAPGVGVVLEVKVNADGDTERNELVRMTP